MFNNSMRKVEFPEINSFNSFFFEPPTPYDRDNHTQSVADRIYICFSVQPGQPYKPSQVGKLTEYWYNYIKNQMQSICDDPNIYMEVIFHDDGKALVTFQFNQILGNRWIARVDQSSIQ